LSCSTVSNISAGSLLYDFSLYEVDFSSLWTIIPDVPDINFPLITFNNTVNATIPVNDGNTGDTISDIYYPNFPNALQLVVPDLTPYNAQILNTTPSTISYLVAGLSDVFNSASDISYTVIYAPDLVISASQSETTELGLAWDEAWERGLINPTASVLYSYFYLMGLSYKMDIRRSEGTNLPAFESWLNTESVPMAIQSSLLALDSQLVENGPEDWNTEYNYTNDGFTPYQVSSVFFGIQEITTNPSWTCYNPYALLADTASVSGYAAPTTIFGVNITGGVIPFNNSAISWTKYQSFKRPRLDSMRAYGRLIIPDNSEQVISGTFTTTAAAISGSRIFPLSVPYGLDITQSIPQPYGQAFIPTPSTIAPSANWNIQTTITSSMWEFDNTVSGPGAAYDTNFTLNIKVPIDLINDLNYNPSLGSQIITINWTGQFFANTSVIVPYLLNTYFSGLYSSCENGQTQKVEYAPGTGICFDVQSFATGTNTVWGNLSACKNDILAIYPSYNQYALEYSVYEEYGDIINFHGRFYDMHGAEFFANANQVLRPQQYLTQTDNTTPVINLGVIVNDANATGCTNGMLYNADNLNIPCPTTLPNPFAVNTTPIQNSSTSVSLSSRFTTLNGKLCPALPSNITQVPQ
jgi:hypothetical protein